MQNGETLIARHVLGCPAQGEVERRQFEAIVIDELAMCRHVLGGVLLRQEWRLGRIDPMNCGENFAALPRHHATRRREPIVTHDPRAERLSRYALRDVALAKAVRWLQDSDDARRGCAHACGRDHQARLLDRTYLRHHPGHRIEALRAELNDELPPRRGCGAGVIGADRVERHCRPIRATGQALQVMNLRWLARMARERGFEPGRKIVIAHALRPRRKAPAIRQSSPCCRNQTSLARRAASEFPPRLP